MSNMSYQACVACQSVQGYHDLIIIKFVDQGIEPRLLCAYLYISRASGICRVDLVDMVIDTVFDALLQQFQVRGDFFRRSYPGLYNEPFALIDTRRILMLAQQPVELG